MNVLTPTYMLLPNFDIAPDTHVRLGSILPLSKQTKRPDPNRVLNEDQRIDPSTTQVGATQSGRIYEGSSDKSGRAGLWADIPILSAISAGFDLGTSSNIDLTIDCEKLETTFFVPKADYIRKATATDFIQQYARQRLRPSVYLVTGIKVARKATIVCTTGKERDGKIDASVDLTSVGAPVQVGPKLEGSRGESATRTYTVDGPFVLAYQLRKVGLRRDGSVRKEEDANQWALFNDTGEDEIDVGVQQWEREWVVEEVVPGTNLED